MSRPRATKESMEAAAREAFRQEVKVRRVYCNMKQSELAEAVGVVPSVMSNLLANPDKINAGRLRKIISVLDIDPMIVLAFLGYNKKDLQNVGGEGNV